MTTFPPDAITFYQFVFSHVPDGKFVGLLGTNPHDKEKYELVHVTDMHAAIKETTRLMLQFDDIFVSIAPRDQQSPKKSAVTQTGIIWSDVDPYKDHEGDIDKLKQKALKQIKLCALPPAMIIDSGRGYHVYWSLVRPLEGTDDIQSVLRSAIVLVNGDEGVNSPEHVMRVPGTINRKDPDDPRECKIVHRADVTVDHRLFALLARLPARVLHKIVTGDGRGYKSRSERDMSVVRVLVEYDYEDNFIAFLFDNYPIGDRHRETDGYLTRTIAKVRETRSSHTDEPADKETKPKKVKRGRTPSGFFTNVEGTFAGSERNNRQVATFAFVPKYVLNTVTNSHVMGHVTYMGAEYENVPISKDAFTRSAKLMSAFHDPEWVWVGSDIDARRWLAWLMKTYRGDMKRVTGTYQTGRFGTSFVTTDCTITKVGIIPAHESSTIWINSGKETTHLRTASCDKAQTKCIVDHIMSTVPMLNEPGVVWPAIGWTIAALAKPAFTESGTQFPILNIAGTRGSGKTTLIMKVLHPLCGIHEPKTYDCGTTNFVLLALLGGTNAIPLAFSEFRLSERQANNIIRKVLLAYDTGSDPRGRADQTTVDYPLSAPFSVDGEDPITDPACLERMVVVKLTPETVLEGSDCNDAFEQFMKMDITPIGTALIQYSLATDVSALYRNAQAVLSRAFPSPMPPRVRHNITVATTGLFMLSEFINKYGHELVIDEEFITNAMKPPLQNVLGDAMGERTALLVDEFIADIINMVMLGRAEGAFAFTYNGTNNILRVHMQTAIAAWREHRRRQNLPVLTPKAMKQQIKERTQEEGKSVKDRYILPGEATSIHGATVWAHGLELNVCADSGLDVPRRLHLDGIAIHLEDVTEVIIESNDVSSTPTQHQHSNHTSDD